MLYSLYEIMREKTVNRSVACNGIQERNAESSKGLQHKLQITEKNCKPRKSDYGSKRNYLEKTVSPQNRLRFLIGFCQKNCSDQF